jgi:hypothetical protein
MPSLFQNAKCKMESARVAVGALRTRNYEGLKAKSFSATSKVKNVFRLILHFSLCILNFSS